MKSIGGEYEAGYIDPVVLAGSAAASFVKYDFKTATFTNACADPNIIMADQFYSTLRVQGFANGSIEGFINGKTGVVIADTDGLKAKGAFKDMDPESIGFTYLPYLQDGTKGRLPSDFVGFGIVKNAPHADAAGYFLRYFLDYRSYDLGEHFISTDAGTFYYELTNTPADQKYYNFESALISISDDHKDFYEELVTPKYPPNPVSPVNQRYIEINDIVNTFVADGNRIIAELREENTKTQ